MFNAQKGLPDTWSPSGIKGTGAHSVFEQLIEGDGQHLLTHESLHVNVETPGYHEDITMVKLERDDLDAVGVAYDYVLSKWTDTARVYSELKVNPEAYLDTPDAKGTADVIIVDIVGKRSVLEVVDYKHGRGHLVEVEGCLQLVVYGLGAVAMMDAEGVHVDEITLTIAQPLMEHKDGFVRSVTLTRDELLAYIPQIKKIIKDAQSKRAKRIAGEYQCRHCKAKRNCVAVTERALATAQATFKPIGKVTTDDISTNMIRDPSCLTPEQRATVLDNAKLIKSWLKVVEEYAWQEDLKGRKTPGFKVVEGQSQRAFISSDEVTLSSLKNLRLSTKKRITAKDVMASKLLSPKQLLTRLKPLVTEKTYAKVEELIKKPTGSMTLVPDTDIRPAVRREPKDVFKKIGGKKKPNLSFLD